MPISGAVRRFIEDDILPLIKIQSRELVRHHMFFAKDIDRLIRANSETLQFAFDKFALGSKHISIAKA